MPTLSKILKPDVVLPVVFEEGGHKEIVTVTYRPQYMTPEFEERMAALPETKQVNRGFVEMFMECVSAWDLKMDEGDKQPIPLTWDGLKGIPYDILGEIIRVIQEDVSPNSPTGTN